MCSSDSSSSQIRLGAWQDWLKRGTSRPNSWSPRPLACMLSALFFFFFRAHGLSFVGLCRAAEQVWQQMMREMAGEMDGAAVPKLGASVNK